MTPNKTRTTISIVASVLAIVITMVISTGCSRPANLSAADINLKLAGLVTQQANKNHPCGNCVLAVVKGDSSYAWAGQRELRTGQPGRR